MISSFLPEEVVNNCAISKDEKDWDRDLSNDNQVIRYLY